MRIIEACINAIVFPVKNKKIGSSPILILKYVPSLYPVNPLFCIGIWKIYTMHVSGKLGPGW